MESILNCKSEDLEDYYGLLGCDELSSTEQILNEFKIKALACHPDKHPENPKAVEEFQKLQEAKEVLTNEESRKNYDLWQRSQLTVPFRDWQAFSHSVKTSMHWAVRAKKEPMLEDSKESSAPSAPSAPRAPEEKASFSKQEQTDDRSSEAHLSSSDFWHQRFRWSADAPSDLLQKFRNYEI